MNVAAFDLWFVVAALVGGLLAAGVYYINTSTFDRSPAGWIFSFLFGVVIGPAALRVGRTLTSAQAPWDWTALAALAGALLGGTYAVISYRTRPAYARSLLGRSAIVVFGAMLGVVIQALALKCGTVHSREANG